METEYQEDATDPTLDMDVTDWPECTAHLDGGIVIYCPNGCYRCTDDYDHKDL